jgi:predicted Zn-dependent protease
MVFDTARARSAGDAAAFLAEWTGGNNVRNVQRIEIGGKQAAVGFANANLNGRPAEAMLAAIPGDGSLMYRFVFLDLQSLDRSDVAAFEESLRSFHRLSAAEAAKYRPLRLEVVTVRAGDTIDSLASRMAVDRGKRELFVVLNGLEERSLQPGDEVKLVVGG